MSEADFGLTGKGQLSKDTNGIMKIDAGRPTSGNPGMGDVVPLAPAGDNTAAPTSPKASGPIK